MQMKGGDITGWGTPLSQLSDKPRDPDPSPRLQASGPNSKGSRAMMGAVVDSLERPGQSAGLRKNWPWGISVLSLTAGYWEGHSISLSLSFLICKTGTVTVSASQNCCEN